MKVILLQLLVILGISRVYAGCSDIIEKNVPQSRDGDKGAAGGGTNRTE